MSELTARIHRCRYATPCLFKVGAKDVSFVCSYCDEMPIEEKDCENCNDFKSRYIEYPISVSKINIEGWDGNYTLFHKDDIGKPVKIRPSGKEYEGKTYLGIFMGDLPIMPHVTHDPRNNELSVRPFSNPAIFVPSLKKIIHGCESWWSIIESENDFKDITDEDIENVWYVKMFNTAFTAGEKKAGDV